MYALECLKLERDFYNEPSGRAEAGVAIQTNTEPKSEEPLAGTAPNELCLRTRAEPVWNAIRQRQAACLGGIIREVEGVLQSGGVIKGLT